VKLCVGPRLALTNIIDYVRKYSLRFANERHFGFFWTNSVSHDFLNMPHNGDLLYSGLIQNLSMSGALDRTVLIVLSDHGIRWGGIRETYQVNYNIILYKINIL
jgi:membrane-anchored protein YejM (alkaline phosphatase superfamily)